MMKQYKKELIVSTLLALLPIAAGLLLWNRLPGQLATHWGMHGADRWSGKAAAVFLQPLLLLAVPACQPAVCGAGTDVRRHRQLFPQMPPQPHRGHPDNLDTGQRGELECHPPLCR